MMRESAEKRTADSTAHTEKSGTKADVEAELKEDLASAGKDDLASASRATSRPSCLTSSALGIRGS